MKDYPKREDNENYFEIDVPLYEGSYDNVSLILMLSLEIEESWVVD